MNKRFLLGACIGATVGAVVALLYAPSAGYETREQLAQKSRETADRIGKVVKRSSEDVEEGVKQAI